MRCDRDGYFDRWLRNVDNRFGGNQEKEERRELVFFQEERISGTADDDRDMVARHLNFAW